MKKSPLFPLLCLLLLQFSISSCSKDEDNQPTKTDMMAAHSWQGEKALVAGIDISTEPALAGMFPDISTVTLTFQKDGTYTSSLTSNGQVINSSGTWEFRENETKLNFDFLSNFGLEETVGIKELTTTRLTLTTNIQYQYPGTNQVVPVPAEVYFVSK